MHLFPINGKYVNDDGTLDFEEYLNCVNRFVEEQIKLVRKVKNPERRKYYNINITFDESKICMCKRHWKNDNTDWTMFD